MSKKLVYVLNYVHPDDVQHFVHVIGLLRALQDRCGWEITLLSEKGGSGAQTVHGMPVRYLSEAGGADRLVALASTLKELRGEGYRLVFVRITKPAALASIASRPIHGMKVLYWLSTSNHDLDEAKPFWPRTLGKLTMSAVVRGVDRFVTGPESMLDYCERAYGVPRDKLMLLYNDIDVGRFQASERRQNGADLRVVFVHSLSPSKQASLYMPSIIAALNRLAAQGAPAHLDLIGDGPERDIVRQQIAAAGPGVTVTMHGAVPNMQLPEKLAAADLFVMPSYREGMPRALMEAMAMGLPAVSTDAGGTRDIVGPLQNAFVVDRDDPAAFGEKLVELAQDKALQARISLENRERIQRYTTPGVADMYDRALSALL